MIVTKRSERGECTMASRITNAVEAYLGAQRDILRREAQKHVCALDALLACRDPDCLTYTIKLNSLWASEGEESHTLTARGRLKELVDRANMEFMRINQRSDVQAELSVYVVLSDGSRDGVVRVPLPRELYKKFEFKRPENPAT